MRFQGTAYRVHEPRWSFNPLSGEGAALRGGRFNPKGVPALYLALDVMTAVQEANQGLPFKIQPGVLCAYEADCEDIIDLTDPAALEAEGVTPEELACGWLAMAVAGRKPLSWRIAERLIARGEAGLVVPSYAPGAAPTARNLVLWTWSDSRPHLCRVIDHNRRLPRDQASWP